MPKLSQFIRERAEDILDEWEAFARTLPSASSMDVRALRDHAAEMLAAIARDLETPQSEQERSEKAREVGIADSENTTAAARHGRGRAETGFSVEQMLAEFRALRASVINLWRQEQQHAGPDELEELTRFNEAIDQAVAESTVRYAREVETTRDRFFAVLGHDLRTPLGVILTSSQFLLETATLTDAERTIVSGMERSGRRMIELIRNLLDLALTGLGNGIPVTPTTMDLGALVRDVVAEVTASNPSRRIDVELRGALAGEWDKARLAQALSNLVGNAVQHGSRDGPIKIVACGNVPNVVTVSVSNEGPPIPSDQLHGLFEPMKGGSASDDRRHLGLGLYIVEKIVDAHGGTIDVRSSQAEGTTFSVSLPRNAGGAAHRVARRA
jgi:signal transduction histidine kinase